MKEDWIGKEAFIVLKNDNGNQNIFTANILEMNDKIISFKDKFGDEYLFPISAIIKIKMSKGGINED